ncbi:MAG: acyl carrier protein [Candidatus Cloacimonetes bacterium]|nr:acyl carrier protein [Candidatus Cloacimonadota bacterium]
MTINVFTKELAELLEIEDDLSLETNLKDYEEYDSMSIMSLVAYVHKTFGKQFNARQLNQIDTVESLVELIGKESFDS